MDILLRQLVEQEDREMRKVKLHTLAGSVQPADNGNTSSPNAQGGYMLPASYPMLTANYAPYIPETFTHSPLVNRNNIAGMPLSVPPILVVDDSPTIRKVIETTLHREGYDTIAFPDGVVAIQWLKTSCPPPRLILLDIELPKMDGYAIARTLKEKPELENTIIIMVSRRDGVIDRLKGRLAGAKDYLTKPFTTEALMRFVSQYLGSKADRMFE